MNVKKYLNRLGIESTNFAPELENLQLLQKKHLLRVPFENLDIHWKRPIILDTKKFYKKIIGQQRGGFCYELNGLFFELLNEVGFQSKLISARVSTGNGNFSAEYDHLTIISKVDDLEYLVDVGFGAFTAEPLKFVLNEEQTDQNGTFLIRKFDDEYFEVVKKEGNDWNSEFIFKDLGRDLAEFSEMCNFHQTSHESHFTRGKVCSLMFENGRKTLTDKKFMITENGQKKELDVHSDEEFNRILEREFGIKQDSSNFG